MSEAPVLWSLDENGIGWITFNRPKVLNALDVPSARALAEAVRGLLAQPGLRAVVMRGAGRAFVAGGDVSDFGADPTQARAQVNAILDAAHEALLALAAQDAPVVVQVQGAAAGAGMSLVLAADLVVAAEDAQFMMAYDRLGAPTDCGATWHLARKLGTGRAAEFYLTSRTLSAAEAQQWGIVTRVVPAEALEAEVAGFAASLAAGPTRAFGAFRRTLAAAHGNSFAEQLEAERYAFVENTGTKDFREGVGAFLTRRKPAFRGD